MKTTEVLLINGDGEVTELSYSLPPEKAIQMAVNQYVFNNYDTFNPKPIDVIESEVSYCYPYGDNSAVWVRK